MIQDCGLVRLHIINWLKEKASGKSCFCLELKTPNDQLLLSIARETLIPVYINSDLPLLNSFTQNIVTFAESNNALILSSFSRNELNLLRMQRKHTDCFDLLPFGDLFQSELDQLSCKKYIPNLKSFSVEETEWLDMENQRSGVVVSDIDPVRSEKWYLYTLRQKQIVALAFQIEKNTRHKILNTPICIVRNQERLVS